MTRYAAYYVRNADYIADTTHKDAPEYKMTRSAYLKSVEKTQVRRKRGGGWGREEVQRGWQVRSRNLASVEKTQVRVRLEEDGRGCLIGKCQVCGEGAGEGEGWRAAGKEVQGTCKRKSATLRRRRRGLGGARRCKGLAGGDVRIMKVHIHLR